MKLFLSYAVWINADTAANTVLMSPNSAGSKEFMLNIDSTDSNRLKVTLDAGSAGGSFCHFFIGVDADSCNGSLGEYFDGKIDDVRIFPYRLSANQLLKIMNEGAVRFGPQ